jgi:hypothetical protein
VCTTQHNAHPLSGLDSKGWYGHKLYDMLENKSGIDLLALKKSGIKFIVGSSQGLPDFIVEALKASKNNRIIIRLVNLANLVNSRTKEFSLTVYQARFNNQAFECMLPLSAIMADKNGKCAVSLAEYKNPQGEVKPVLRLLAVEIDGTLTEAKDIAEGDVWAALEGATKPKKAKKPVIEDDDDDDFEEED